MTDTVVLASREAFEKLNDRKPPVGVDVPGWGRAFLRDPPASAREEWEAFLTLHQGKADAAPWRAKVAQLLLCDESGNTLFTEADLPFLGERNATAMTTIFREGLKLLAITDEELAVMAGN